MKVVQIGDGNQALVEIGGVRKEISLAFVDDVTVGDYVIVHVGFALAPLDTEEAEASLQRMGTLVLPEMPVVNPSASYPMAAAP